MKKTILLALIVLASHTYAQQIHDTISTETNIVLQAKTAKIKGTLSVPSKGRKFPLVIIIAGSGPTDRNGNSGSDVTSNSYKILADSLLQHNIASLRYDKRGIGESADSTIKEANMVFETYITDAKDWVTLLKKDKRFSSIIIAGHSEGSLVGMVASVNKNVARYISIAGPGVPVYKTLKKQLAGQSEAIKKTCYAIIDTLVSGKIVTAVPAMLSSIFRPSVQPYLISWFKYDPKIEIAKLKIPVLVINGTSDIQVAVDNATNLHDACRQSKLVIIEGMTHLLKEGPADRDKNIALYKTTPNEPIKTELVIAIVHFINTK